MQQWLSRKANSYTQQLSFKVSGKDSAATFLHLYDVKIDAFEIQIAVIFLVLIEDVEGSVGGKHPNVTYVTLLFDHMMQNGAFLKECNFKKPMCCTFNNLLDAYISNRAIP